MLENYYKKYGILKDSGTQERILKQELQHLKRLYMIWENEKSRYAQMIAETEANPNLSDEDKKKKRKEVEKTLEESEQVYLDLQQKEFAINDALTLDEDRIPDGTTRDERIRTIYMTYIFYERNIRQIARLEKEAMSLPGKEAVKQQEMLDEAEQLRKELNEAFNILSDPRLRKAYDEELRIQEHIENLKKDKLARIKLSEMHVKSVLGEDFNPDLSEIGTQSKLNFRRMESRGLRPYRWKAILYEKPEELFVGSSKYPETPEIDASIYAFRYGRMEFSYLFRSDGQDGLSEIIGVTKIDKSGRERTEFVIAPLIDLGEIKSVTQQEYEELLANDQNPIIIETPEEVSIREARERYLTRMAQKYPKPPKHDKKRQQCYTRFLKSFLIGDKLDKAQKEELYKIDEEARLREQRKVIAESPKIIDLYEAVKKMQMKSEQHNPEDIRHIFLARTVKKSVLPEDKSFFANVYLSDYLIENAVSNNAGYLGSFEKKGGKRSIIFDNPMERQRIEACFYASEHSGDITKLGARTGFFANRVEAYNTDALFSILKNAQKELVKRKIEESKKKGDFDQVDL